MARHFTAQIFTFTLLLCGVAFPDASFADERAKTCLSYTSVGDSSCGSRPEEPVPATPEIQPEVEVKVEPAPQTVVRKPVPETPSLDDKIDEYLEGYGKPPREFVAFNLEPTLENALIWAKKYRELMERNHKLTAAWGQAQSMLDDYEAGGGQFPGYQPMAEVPDFGVPLTGSFRGMGSHLPSQQNDYSGIAANSARQQQMGAPSLGFASSGINTNSARGAGVGDGAVRIGGSESTTSRSLNLSGKPVEISYYFSAECPFCKEFEVGFKGLIEELGSRIKVICVDMTPSKRVKENIHGKIDCSWRAAVPGEARAFGVQSTPTLLVNRHNGEGLEKVEGLVEISRLRAFLKGEI